MRFEDGEQQPELKEICLSLSEKGNFDPVVVGPLTYYRRGKGGKWLYRVPNEDFKVETEKSKPKGKQLRFIKRIDQETKQKVLIVNNPS